MPLRGTRGEQYTPSVTNLLEVHAVWCDSYTPTAAFGNKENFPAAASLVPNGERDSGSGISGVLLLGPHSKR